VHFFLYAPFYGVRVGGTGLCCTHTHCVWDWVATRERRDVRCVRQVRPCISFNEAIIDSFNKEKKKRKFTLIFDDWEMHLVNMVL